MNPTETMTGASPEANSVRKSVMVAVAPEVAFEVFSDLSRWWPTDTHHLGSEPPVKAVLEPRIGGRCFERAQDGTETVWGHVLAWDPPRRLLFTWEIDADWKSNPNVRSEVEVRFIPSGEEGVTRVDLEHRKLEAFGARRDEMRGIFGGKGGWTGLLERFARATAS